MSYENKYHADWQDHRIKYLEKRFGKEWFNNKTILELGPFNGYIGNWLHELGAKVTCVEGRQENYDHIRGYFPHLTVIKDNLDTEGWPYGDFDLIVNMGLIYHLEKYPEAHLRNCISHCKTMILESVISDSTGSMIKVYGETGPDQSLSDWGGDPSVSWFERILSETSCSFERILDMGNAGKHMYSEVSGSGSRFSRAMWIVTPKETI